MNNSKPLIIAGVVAIAGAFAWQSLRSQSTKATSALQNALDPQAFVPLRLHSIQKLTHNTAIYRFSFPNDSCIAHEKMTVASCLLTKFSTVEGGERKDVIRPYTPITSPAQKGYLDLLVKSYPNGVMSKHIAELKVGDELLFKGPIEKIKYEPNKWSHIGMVAGGTGITPMWQVIQKALSDKTDKTRITLLFGNHSQDDILLKQELDKLSAKYPDRFKVYYTIDKKVDGWTGFTGHVNQDLYSKASLPLPSDPKSIVFVCGPPGMMKAISGPKAKDKSQGLVDPQSLLGKLGFEASQVFKF